MFLNFIDADLDVSKFDIEYVFYYDIPFKIYII